jgi:hypothetical protein
LAGHVLRTMQHWHGTVKQALLRLRTCAKQREKGGRVCRDGHAADGAAGRGAEARHGAQVEYDRLQEGERP